MGDNTELPAGSGGDLIRTEVVGLDAAGREIKVQLQKVLTGRGPDAVRGVTASDDGDVTAANAFPVEDAKCRRLLEEILVIEAENNELLQEIRDALNGAAAGGVRSFPWR